MKPPIFLLSGSPGAGKSSVAVALLQRFEYGIHIPVDDLREWVVAGIAHPVPTRTAEAMRQFRLARHAAAQTASIYHAAGFAVVIDDVLFPDDAETQFVAQLPNTTLHKILLFPSLEATLQRNQQRTNKQFATDILIEPIRAIHAAISQAPFADHGWQIIDSTHLTLEQTVERIIAEA